MWAKVLEHKLTSHLLTYQVPPYFTDEERKGMLDAASLAGLNVLSLINTQTAGVLTIFSFLWM